MASIHNSVDTVNAAATAIVTAESRVQPTTVQKRRWGSCWSLYWCFGSYKHSKRIGHAVLVPEPTVSTAAASSSGTTNHSTTIVVPFIAPPSSPASFLQSDPSSETQSPAGLLSLASLSFNAYSPGGTASIFAIGPYAHETQLVSPPVFSAVTTEPSTAAFTPPPESVQPTAPSSPEVPFAQLLASSLAQNRRNNKTNLKFSLSQYEFQPYQYPGSPGSHLISPGSVVSNSGTSSPFPDKNSVIELRMAEASKFVGYDHFTPRKWGSRLGSGSLTPNGWGSRLGSGTLTPNGGLSRLGSGTLTPTGGEPVSQDIHLLENQISEVASLANSDNAPQDQDVVTDHRVSFELTNDDLQSCLGKELAASQQTTSGLPSDATAKGAAKKDVTEPESMSREYSLDETITENSVEDVEGDAERCFHKRRTITLGSSKDFNFDNMEGKVSEKSIVECEWWKNEKVAANDIGTSSDWTFFPMLQPGVS